MMTPLRLAFAGYQPPGSVHSKSGRLLIERLASALAGGADLSFDENVTTAGTPMTSLMPRTAGGEFDMFYIASSYLAATCPSLGVLDMPFPAWSRRELFAALDEGELGRRLRADVAASTPFRLLGFWDNGVRHLSNAVRPIREPSDCVGLRIRTLDNSLHQAAFRAMGFDPVFVDMRDFRTAIAEGAVEAQENPLTNLVTFEVCRHHPHVSLTGHFQGVVLMLANAAWFDGLAALVRAALIEALGEATAHQRQLALEEDDTCAARLTGEGARILGPADLDLEQFRASVAPVADSIVAGLDPHLRSLIG